MKKIDELVLKYHKLTYIIEAYKIFYGEYPNFNDEESEIKKTQLMMYIISNYKIKCMDEFKYNPTYSLRSYEGRQIGMPYSYELSNIYRNIKEKLENSVNLECDLEQLCKEKPLSEPAKRDIRLLSFLIKEQSKKNEQEPMEFLLELCNAIEWMHEYPFEFYCDVEALANYYKENDFEINNIKEMAHFILLDLRILQTSTPTEYLRHFKNISEDILNGDSHSGLLIKDKVLTKNI